MFQVYLNDILLEDEPLGLKDFPEVLERDNVLKGFFIKYPGELTFSGDGYEILKSGFDNFGYCNLYSLKILQQCGENTEYEPAFNGNIILSDVKFNLSKCLATTSVVDNSYSAKIFNNKSIKANVSATKSKTGVDITPAETRLVDFFNPVDGVYTGDTRKVVDVFEAFKFLVAFMTDGEVSFASSYLSGFTDTENLCLVTGIELRAYANDSMPIISFQELFDNINKKFPIGFIIENDGDENYTLRIENESYFYSTQGTYQFSYVPNLQQSVDTNLLYSGLTAGSSETVSYNPCRHSMVPSPIFGFNTSEFYFQTKCNIDSILNLVSSYIIDSNIIEELVRSGITGEEDCNGDEYGVNRTYDNDVLLVQYSKIDNEATRCTILNTSPPYQYNEVINNFNVISRRNLLGNISQYFNQTGLDNSFYAEGNNIATQDISGVIDTEIDFNTDLSGAWGLQIEDPNNNYSPSTSTYTAPTDGFYKFDAHSAIVSNRYHQDYGGGLTRWLDIELSIGYILNSNTFYLSGTRKDYFNDDLYEEIDHVLIKGNGGLTLTNQFVITDIEIDLDPLNIYLNTGDIIQFFIKVTPKAGVVSTVGPDQSGETPFPSGMTVTNFMSRINLRLNPSYVSVQDLEVSQDYLTTSVTPDGGGIIVEDTGDDYYSSLLNFTYPINNTDWQTMKTQMLNSFNVNIDGVSNKVGWINKIERNIETGMAEVELTSNLNNI